MTHLASLTTPYVEALFSVVPKADLADWSRLMRVCAEFSGRDTQKILRSKALPSEQLINLVDKVLQQVKITQTPEAFKRFLQVLAHNKRLALLPDIAQAFLQRLKAQSDIVSAEVTSAMPLDAAAQTELQKSLETALGKTVELTVKLDASLLAGIIIQMGEQVIDNSIRGKLNKLAATLI